MHKLTLRTFPGWQTPDEVVDKLIADSGSATQAIDDLQNVISMIQECASLAAIVVQSPDKVTPRRSESSAALSLLRPGKRY